MAALFFWLSAVW